MSHLTLYEADGHGTETQWGDHVTEEEYAALPGRSAEG
jgi:hypothetical protein